MALVDNAWYVDYGNGSSTGYYAVTAWATGASKSAGALVRQNTTPTVGNERVFICVVAGTTHATTEPTWTVTRGAKVTDNTVTWQECTGIAAINGDATNTPDWTTVKNTAVTLGQVIKRNNGASYQICTTAGTAGNGAEPSFSDTAGTTTSDNTVTWTSIGVVGNFTGWQAPFARLASACAANWAQLGNSIYVASEHAETQTTSITIAPPGTSAQPCKIECVTKTAVPPGSANCTTGATISATGASSINLNSSVGNQNYYRGLTFNAGSSTNGANLIISNSTGRKSFKDCTFTINNTSSSSKLYLTNTTTGSTQLDFDNCTFNFGATGQSFSAGTVPGACIIKGGTIGGSGLPTTLFTNMMSYLLLEGVDLSAFGSGKTIFTNNPSNAALCILKNCKLGTSVTKSGTPSNPYFKSLVITSDSSATNNNNEVYTYAGTQTPETTIVRTGGAATAWKIVTTANAKWIVPFEALPITIDNTTTGSAKTVTIYGIWGGGAVPNNDDIWMDVAYMGSTLTPVVTIASGTKSNNLASGSAQSSDTSTWGGSTTKFKMTATFTPQIAGPITIYIKAAAVSSTFYIDPKVVLS